MTGLILFGDMRLQRFKLRYLARNLDTLDDGVLVRFRGQIVRVNLRMIIGVSRDLFQMSHTFRAQLQHRRGKGRKCMRALNRIICAEGLNMKLNIGCFQSIISF